jgi:hypothetical protein
VGQGSLSQDQILALWGAGPVTLGRAATGEAAHTH